MNPDTTETLSWPDLAVGLYDRLTGRNAQISYDFRDLEVNVPSHVSPEATQAPWKINGMVTITTRDQDRG